MKLLVLNVGSSTIKYKLFVRTKGSDTSIKLLDSGLEDSVKDYEKSLKKILRKVNDFEIIIHRVVHGGDLKNCLIDNRVLRKIEKYSEYAPLHNIPELKVIKICRRLLPKVKQFAVFDTCFHRTILEKAKIYGLPYEYYEKSIRKYGFHGISHKYVSRNLKGKVISCHLGSGCSISAIKDGKSIDTSMGFTPLEGVLMGTRTGDIDAGVIVYLIKEKGLGKVNDLLNNESGLKGLCGYSDFRDVLRNLSKKRVRMAFDVFVYRIVKYIGAYSAVLNGVDSIVFTGAIGENSSLVRKGICKNLGYLGVKIDDKKNLKNEKIISGKDSKIKVIVIKTDEELMMVEEILK